MTKYSILTPFSPHRPGHIAPFAALTQWTAAARLWQGQSMAADAHHAFINAAAAGFGVPTGIGVSLTPLRHPIEAALLARSVAGATGHSMVAGFGPGGRNLQQGMLEAPYKSPLTAMREYITAVRAVLGQGKLPVEGEYFTARFPLPPLPGPPIELGLGVLRPGMARLSGEVADVAITWLTPAKYIRDVIVPAMREGAEAVGRPMPRVAAIVPMALAGADRDPVHLVRASNEAHLTGPHYRDMLRQAGIHVDAEDREQGAKALVAGRAFLYGDMDELASGFAEYADAGVDEIVLNLTGVYNSSGSKAALDEIYRILGEVAG